MDLPDAKKNLKRFKKKFGSDIIAISAQERDGLEELVARIIELLKTTTPTSI